MASSTTASPAGAIAAESTPPNRLADVLLWLLLVLLTFSLPKPPALELDASWRMGLTYFLEHGYAFGRDIIFTYGPLGFLLGRTYSGDLLWALIGWQLLQAAVAATLIMKLGRHLHGVSRFFFYAFFVLFGVGYEDALHTILIVLLGWSMIRKLAVAEEKPSLVLPAIFFGLLSVIKFTNLMLSGVVVVVVVAFAVLRRRPSFAYWLVSIYAGTFLALWVACSQPLSALPSYVINSLDISAGYQATMGLPTPFAPFWKAGCILLLIAGYIGWHLRTQADRMRSAACFLILGAFLYLNWKHGFVRADGHMLGFFYSTLLVSLSFPALFGERGRSLWIARALLIPVAFLSIWGVRDALTPVVDWAGNITNEKVVKNLRAITAWPTVRQDLNNQLTLQRTNADLPKTRAVVAKSSIDVLGFEQGVALFNQFNYTPRPVFQSYSAYTPRLDEINADFYASSRAPDYALLKLQTIDERPLMLDDSQVLRIFPHYYQFVLAEKGFQLWRRRATAPSADQLALRPLKELSLPIGLTRTLGELERQPLWAVIDLPPSLIGRVRNFLYKPPVVQLRVVDNHQHEEIYRLPLMAARAGFLLNPLVTDIDSYIESQGGKPKRWVHSLELTVDAGDARYFAPSATVQLSAVAPSNAKPEYDRQLERAKYSMFSLVPDETTAFTTPSEIDIDGHNALVMHAPSLMVFTPPAGVRHVSGNFGYPTGAYLNGGNTDGAEFRVVWATGKERRVLFSQLIRPVQVTKDRGLHHFDVDLSHLPAGGKLQLEVSPGPNDEHSWDWTAWADVVIQ